MLGLSNFVGFQGAETCYEKTGKHSTWRVVYVEDLIHGVDLGRGTCSQAIRGPPDSDVIGTYNIQQIPGFVPH